MITEAEEELKIIHTSFTDQHLLVLRDDKTAIVLHVSHSGDVEEHEEFTDVLQSTKWSCGCLYKPSGDAVPTYAFLLSTEGNLQVLL